MTKRISAFEKQCVTINRRLKDKASEKTTNEIYYRSLKVGTITRMWHKRRIYYCSECGCEVNNNVFAKECPQCHAKWNSGGTLYVQNGCGLLHDDGGQGRHSVVPSL